MQISDEELASLPKGNPSAMPGVALHAAPPPVPVQAPQKSARRRILETAVGVLLAWGVIQAISALSSKRSQADKPKNIPEWLANPPAPTITAEDIAISDAKQLLRNTLHNPKAAQFLAAKVRDHQGSFYLVQLLLDAQNGFGAMIRSNYCIVVELSADQKEFYYNKQYGVQECKNPPEQGELDLIKAFNKWGKASDPTKIHHDDSLKPE